MSAPRMLAGIKPVTITIAPRGSSRAISALRRIFAERTDSAGNAWNAGAAGHASDATAALVETENRD